MLKSNFWGYIFSLNISLPYIGGGFYLLGVQLLAAVSYTIWSSCVTFLLLWVIALEA